MRALALLLSYIYLVRGLGIRVFAMTCEITDPDLSCDVVSLRHRAAPGRLLDEDALQSLVFVDGYAELVGKRNNRTAVVSYCNSLVQLNISRMAAWLTFMDGVRGNSSTTLKSTGI